MTQCALFGCPDNEDHYNFTWLWKSTLMAAEVHQAKLGLIQQSYNKTSDAAERKGFTAKLFSVLP